MNRIFYSVSISHIYSYLKRIHVPTRVPLSRETTFSPNDAKFTIDDTYRPVQKDLAISFGFRAVRQFDVVISTTRNVCVIRSPTVLKNRRDEGGGEGNEKKNKEKKEEILCRKSAASFDCRNRRGPASFNIREDLLSNSPNEIKIFDDEKQMFSDRSKSLYRTRERCCRRTARKRLP